MADVRAQQRVVDGNGAVRAPVADVVTMLAGASRGCPRRSRASRPASLIIVTGTGRDAARLELAKRLGADAVIDVQAEDALTRIMDITGGNGVDIVLDCTAGAGTGPVLLGIDALKRRELTLLIQGELSAFPGFPVQKITEKAITIKSARGHSFRACELAVRQRPAPRPGAAAWRSRPGCCRARRQRWHPGPSCLRATG